MAKILVSLADAAEQDKIITALRLKKHTIITHEPMTKDDDPKALARALTETGADVAILDYIIDDAVSVKVLQAATEQSRNPRFIFILPDMTPVSHILMAVNEGAAAILEAPVNEESLAIYIERAISGPARFRHEITQESNRYQEISENERDMQVMKIQVAAYRTLISYLMSTASSMQHRNAMIVSDSAYQRDYLKKLLEENGFSVIQAANPEEGIAQAMEHKPRIVISDLEMEGKNGIEFCHELKIVHKFIPCYFVICTANSERINEVLKPGNGVDACVLKPSSENGNKELIAAVAMGLLL
jgi:Response regulators consisting of a CheY-like receiver domain and a winged-helix DNA-binding domain